MTTEQKRMTREQLETLELPAASWEFVDCGTWWAIKCPNGTHSRVITLAYMASDVANGQLQRPAYDWAMRAYKGGDVPTVEQWEAAERLAVSVRNDAHPDSIRTKLANVISPPKLPTIEPCPHCRERSKLFETDDALDPDWYVQCSNNRCAARGPLRATEREAVDSYNEIARKVRPAEPKPRTCGECRHWHRNGGCGHPNYWGGTAPEGTLKVLEIPASTTRDASKCERWEPKS